MSDLISRSALIDKFNDTGIQIAFDLPVEEKLGEDVDLETFAELVQDAVQAYKKMVIDVIQNLPTAYNVDAVVEEVEKLDLDGISMVEDGKYKLIRKKEAISLIQTNGICKGRYKTCAECYKKDCPLSTEKTITDKWGDEVRKGGVND